MRWPRVFAPTPRFGRGGGEFEDSESLVSGGTVIAAVSDSYSVLLAHIFSRRISARRIFVCGPVAARSLLNILRKRRG